MTLLFLGDMHGEFEEALNVIRSVQEPFHAVVQTGDFGFWKYILEHAEKREALKEICRTPVYFVRGNHEQYTLDGEPFFNAYPERIKTLYFPDIENMPIHLDGDIAELDGIRIMGIGGALSMDRLFRKEGVSWWKEEAVSEEVIDTALEVGDPDLIVSHAAPYSWAQYHSKGRYPKLGNKLLDRLYTQKPPKVWIHGHYHHWIVGRDPRSGTRFYGLPKAKEGYMLLDTKTLEVKMVKIDSE